MIDEKTQHLALPLPHEKNELQEDLPRLRDSFKKIDAFAQKTTEAFTSGTEQLEGLYETFSAELTDESQQREFAILSLRGDMGKEIADLGTTTQEAIASESAHSASTYAPKNVAIKVTSPLTGGGTLAATRTIGLATAAEGDTLIFKGGKWTFGSRYELCKKPYFFLSPDIDEGFYPMMGGIVENADKKCPDAWDYLQTEAGQFLCVTESVWQAMNTAIWHTNADGSEVGWNGIGGVPKFVIHTEEKTIRLPDVRGMYPEASGFDSLGVGGVHGDGTRPITGEYTYRPVGGIVRLDSGNESLLTGAFTHGKDRYVNTPASGQAPSASLVFDIERVTPIANKFQPRAYGALACVYLGIPK